MARTVIWQSAVRGIALEHGDDFWPHEGKTVFVLKHHQHRTILAEEDVYELAASILALSNDT